MAEHKYIHSILFLNDLQNTYRKVLEIKHTVPFFSRNFAQILSSDKIQPVTLDTNSETCAYFHVVVTEFSSTTRSKICIYAMLDIMILPC